MNLAHDVGVLALVKLDVHVFFDNDAIGIGGRGRDRDAVVDDDGHLDLGRAVVVDERERVQALVLFGHVGHVENVAEHLDVGGQRAAVLGPCELRSTRVLDFGLDLERRAHVCAYHCVGDHYLGSRCCFCLFCLSLFKTISNDFDFGMNILELKRRV